MTRNITFIACSALALALLAWTGVIFLALSLEAQETSLTAHTEESQHLSSQSSQSAYRHALVTNSQAERGKLDALVDIDPSTLADTITTAGQSAGISIQISNASQTSLPSPGSKIATQALSFSATFSGSFSSAMYAAELLETLPVPSSIQEIQLTHQAAAPGVPDAAAAWQMNAQLQILSDSTISS